MFNVEEELKKLPRKPGVYIMRDDKDVILYVGKAINLHNRVRSYFRENIGRGPAIDQMVSLIARFEYIVTDSELEALVLENNLIKVRRSKAERDRWAELIGDFFDSERSFNLVVSLVDIRHDPSKLDHDMIDYLQGNEFNFIVCLTKADKLSRTQQARQAAAIKKQLNVPAENVIITSSQTGTGIDELKKRIAEACL